VRSTSENRSTSEFVVLVSSFRESFATITKLIHQYFILQSGFIKNSNFCKKKQFLPNNYYLNKISIIVSIIVSLFLIFCLDLKLRKKSLKFYLAS